MKSWTGLFDSRRAFKAFMIRRILNETGLGLKVSPSVHPNVLIKNTFELKLSESNL